MKIYKDIEQHTEEWHMFRYGKIGGTRSKGLFTKTDTLLIAKEKSKEIQLEIEKKIKELSF